jgi:hypothetical protein
MNRMAWLQDRRMQKSRAVLSRWERKELSANEAGEFLGISETSPYKALTVSSSVSSAALPSPKR